LPSRDAPELVTRQKPVGRSGLAKLVTIPRATGSEDVARIGMVAVTDLSQRAMGPKSGPGSASSEAQSAPPSSSKPQRGRQPPSSQPQGGDGIHPLVGSGDY